MQPINSSMPRELERLITWSSCSVKQARHFIPYIHIRWMVILGKVQKGRFGTHLFCFIEQVCHVIMLKRFSPIFSCVVMNPNFAYRSCICISTCTYVWLCTIVHVAHTFIQIFTYVQYMSSTYSRMTCNHCCLRQGRAGSCIRKHSFIHSPHIITSHTEQ